MFLHALYGLHNKKKGIFLNHISHIRTFKLVNFLNFLTFFIWFTQQKKRNYFEPYKSYKVI
jgi:hypothetical protein